MASLNEDQEKVVNDNGRNSRKYPRGIARVFINFIVFTRVVKGFKVFTMARVQSNGKFKRRLTQAEVVNKWSISRKLPKVPRSIASVH